MDNKVSKKINYIGILVWLILFPLIIPLRLFKNYPLIILGYLYTIFIITINIYFIGDKKKNYNSDLNNSKDPNRGLDLVNLINNKAIQVSTAIFALALATNNILKKETYKQLLLFMIYTLIFGVGIIIPIYFISNTTKTKRNKINHMLIRIRNISLSYSVGFMISGFMLVISSIYNLKY